LPEVGAGEARPDLNGTSSRRRRATPSGRRRTVRSSHACAHGFAASEPPNYR
jgi:hypothetical protein